MNSSNNMVSNLGLIANKINKVKSAREIYEEQYCETRRQIKKLERKQTVIIKSIRIIQEVAQATQQELECKISEIVTAAIQAVFKEKDELKITFEMKRNKTEAEITVFNERGHTVNLLNDDGGGLIDIVTFSLRLACWRIKATKSAPIFLFDEPFKNLSKKYLPAAIQFMHDIREKLGVQIIMITHISELAESADKNIEIV